MIAYSNIFTIPAVIVLSYLNVILFNSNSKDKNKELANMSSTYSHHIDRIPGHQTRT